MPTYAYRCAACDHAFEQYQAFTEDTLTDCPACGQPQLRKVFNSIGVTFNGSGFYRTDSRSAGEKTGSSSTSSSSSSSSSASSSGTKSSDGAGSSSGSAPKPAAAATTSA